MSFIRNYVGSTMNKSNKTQTNTIDFYAPQYYLNRELSLIEFNRKVLLEATGNQHPLLERLKFVCIFSSNLDEFFMIRVAGLKSQIAEGVIEYSYDGKTPREQLTEIRNALLPLYQMQEKLLIEEILPELRKYGVVLHRFDELDEKDKSYLEKYFRDNIMPVLTPLTLGPANPFPRLINRSLNIAFAFQDNLSDDEERRIGFLQIPTVVPRFIPLNGKRKHNYILVEQVIRAFAEQLYPGMTILSSNTFRVTRDADIEIAEDEAEDLLSEIAEQVKQRRWGGAAVRLEVNSNMPDFVANILMKSLDLEPTDVYTLNRPLNLPDFMELLKLELKDIKDKPFSTRDLPQFKQDGPGVFEAIRQSDLLVHHPYDSFTNSTLRLLNQAADDPDVLAIKITLYRTGRHSAIVEALKRAAENGKYVTAFVELKARFDEESNIIWAKELENVGVHVVYGVPGLKTHCKIALIVRREGGKLKKYLHLSTGNYNQVTTRIYTDIAMFTSNDEFGDDAVDLFNYLTGYSHYNNWKHFSVAPINLHNKLISLIRREAELHSPDNPGLIIAKLNQIAQKEVIAELYKASCKGVRIQLICRGVCCLKPGVPNVSENIEVRSILGRFLEHSRVFYFKNGGNEEVYLSSADWMTRNLHRRVEIMFPIYQNNLKKQLIELLHLYWKDNTKSWRLLPDGSYEKNSPSKGAKPFSVQEYLLRNNKNN